MKFVNKPKTAASASTAFAEPSSCKVNLSGFCVVYPKEKNIV
jgi:hypothetical protein